MKCPTFEQLIDYLDNRLPQPEALSLANHLATGCAACEEWNPAAIAIVHTHPNGSDPRPAEQDKQVADKYGVPNFTLTLSGMYVYDPATKKTAKC